MAAKSDESDTSAAWMHYTKEAVSSSRDLLMDDEEDPDVEQHMSLISLPEDEIQHYDNGGSSEFLDAGRDYGNDMELPPPFARIVSSDLGTTTTKSSPVEGAFKRQKLCSSRWMKSLVAVKQNCQRSKWPRVKSASSSTLSASSVASGKAYDKKRHLIVEPKI